MMRSNELHARKSAPAGTAPTGTFGQGRLRRKRNIGIKNSSGESRREVEVTRERTRRWRNTASARSVPATCGTWRRQKVARHPEGEDGRSLKLPVRGTGIYRSREPDSAGSARFAAEADACVDCVEGHDHRACRCLASRTRRAKRKLRNHAPSHSRGKSRCCLKPYSHVPRGPSRAAQPKYAARVLAGRTEGNSPRHRSRSSVLVKTP